MNKIRKAILFINDFTDQGKEKFFLWSETEKLIEIKANDIIDDSFEFICHDYWLLAPAIYRKTKNLPKHVIDVEDLRTSTSGKREDRENREKVDFSQALIDFSDKETVGRYINIIYKNKPFDADTFRSIGRSLILLAENLENKAREASEWDRYIEIERPVTNYLIKSTSEGIAIEETALRRHKAKIDFSYYMALKEFSAKYSLPLEVPTDEEVIEYLEPKFDFSGVSLDYILNFVPMNDGFSDALIQLRKLSNFRKILNSIPLSQKRIHPIVDSFGSVTSRIYFKDPSLQNLSKKHRDILKADDGLSLSYIDYDQYEAGIMGALSGDEKMLTLFSSGDLYSLAAEEIFSDREKRKQAKRLFLSYAYGMKRKSLIDAAKEFGAVREDAKKFFDQFSTFEKWKNSVWEEFRSTNRIGTSFGNYLNRDKSGELSEKEKRSAVSQVVQGTASLIFKKSLIKLSEIHDIKLKAPMHDAVLFQHSPDFDTKIIIDLFSKVMTDHFENRIHGKASLSNFISE
ncbi:TPA: DNA polymerase I [Burkholderia cenocepacia]|nr:DNA polymerase I [Burkholderia cenocepacia]HDR9883606.1 DNA polymerase I [Burkholderia cenocepacia]